MQCNKCGSTIKDGLNFCTKCGADLILTQATQTFDIEKRYCTNCGEVIENGGFCTNCGAKTNDNFTTEVKSNKKVKLSKKLKMIAVCVALGTVAICVLLLFLGLNAKKTQEEYMNDFADYVTISGYTIETNDVGEKIAIAKVECPDYKSIYDDVFKETSSDDATDEEISAEFFGKVSKRLEDDCETIAIEVTINLSEKDYEKTENDSWIDDEITELLKQRAVVQSFEEFCIDKIMEHAPEITEEGALGDTK